MVIAKEDLGLKFELRWRPYFLNPNIKRAIPKRTAYGKRMDATQVVKMEKGMKKLFKDEGIAFTLDGDMNSTLDSHKLMELALGSSLQDQLAEVLFRNYFTEAKDIGARDVLLAAAEEVGLEGAAECLASGEMSMHVLDDIKISMQSHPMLTGVPHYVLMAVDEATGEIKNGFEVPGAQDTLTFLSVIRKLKNKVWDPEGNLLEASEKSKL